MGVLTGILGDECVGAEQSRVGQDSAKSAHMTWPLRASKLPMVELRAQNSTPFMVTMCLAHSGREAPGQNLRKRIEFTNVTLLTPLFFTKSLGKKVIFSAPIAIPEV